MPVFRDKKVKQIFIILFLWMIGLGLLAYCPLPDEKVQGYQIPRVLTSLGFERAMRYHGPYCDRRINPENGSLEFKRDGEWCLVLTKGCMEYLRKGNK